MKITFALAAVVGTLAVLTPLTCASDAIESDSIAVNDAEREARDISACGAPRRKHHHKKGNKKNKAKAQYIQNHSPQPPQRQHRQHKISSARPSNYYPGTQQVAQDSTATSKKTKGSAAGGATGTAGTTGSSSGSSNLSSFEKIALDMHNADRAKHSVAPLTWDSTLASAAAHWAKGCKWKHTPNNPYGQNIAAGTAANFGEKDSCTMWYNEISKYNFASGQYSEATGHFTQMVWKGSKKLGCAIQDCTAAQMGLGSGGGAKYVVCNYDPPGNVIGQFLENVLPN